jgi:phage terminase large subunit
MISRREENIRRNAEYFKSLGFKNPIPDKPSIKRKRKAQQPEALRKSERSKNKCYNTISKINAETVVEDNVERKYQKFVIPFVELTTFIAQSCVKISEEVVILLFQYQVIILLLR